MLSLFERKKTTDSGTLFAWGGKFFISGIDLFGIRGLEGLEWCLAGEGSVFCCSMGRELKWKTEESAARAAKTVRTENAEERRISGKEARLPGKQ